jgi:arylformamidase
MNIIDLSHVLNSHMPVYPGTEKPDFRKVCNMDKDGFVEHQIVISTHTGTHIDVPAHLITDSNCINNFTASHFIGAAIIIDCGNRNLITLETIKNGMLYVPPPDFILLRTGWESYWGCDSYFHHFPVLESAAARFIADLPLKGIGIDASSFDKISSTDLKNHKILLSKNLILIENLCNLSQLPPCGFLFSCLPLKIEEADGSPVRAIAIIET